MSSAPIDPTRCALVVIDLQKMIVERDLQPRSGKEVVTTAAGLANRVRELGGFVVLVRVSFSRDLKDRLMPSADNQMPPTAPPEGYDTLCPELGPDLPGTHIVDKRQWGAFTGTDLDMQLRRRGIDTVLLCGISTNIGVESTARHAFELGYRQFFVEDAMACLSKEEHDHTVKFIFPRIGHVVTAAEIVLSAP